MLEHFFRNLPTLETERLILRKLKYEDKSDIFKYAKNPKVAEHVIWYAHQNEMDTIDFLNFTYDSYNKNLPASWGIEWKENNKIIGTVGFNSFDVQNQKGEIGYALSQEYWGKGIIVEACKEIIEIGFKQLFLNRIEARCSPENVNSAKVLEKLGFTFEGILRQQIFAKEKFWDLKIYSLLLEDFRK
ncbi:MAG: GNAT family N-acetyltransferase [Ignavibacteriales bacterium]|nr:GNAT family N-acetyltransferase [Ignavibacteriales bacterium]